MSQNLACETCTEPTDTIDAAIAHVSMNPGHVVTGSNDEDGTTTRVSTYEEGTDL